SYTLPANAQSYVAVRAIDEQGNIGLPVQVHLHPPIVLPELGRCVRVARGTGEFGDRRCTRSAAGGKFGWSSGPGLANSLTGHFATVTLETVHGSKIACSSGSSSGEYTGPKTLTLTL